jgi:RNA recognition motif-containing protein
MAKIYIGGLPQEITEEALKSFLDEQKVIYDSVLVKKGGYAFVDISSNELAKEIIVQLNGKTSKRQMYFETKLLFLLRFFPQLVLPPPTAPPTSVADALHFCMEHLNRP